MTQKAVTALKTLMITLDNNYALHAPFRKGDVLEHWKRLLLHIKSERNKAKHRLTRLARCTYVARYTVQHLESDSASIYMI
jgi:hypothetical protein